MKMTREQKRVRMMTAAARLVDGLLAWEETNSAPNLTEIEDEVMKLREEFGQEVARAVLEGQEAGQPAAVSCAGCGQAMRYKGQKATELESWVVSGALTRGYYYCSRCQRGLFPPGCAT